MARTPRKWQGARTPSGLKRVRQAERRHAILQPRRSTAKTLVAKSLDDRDRGSHERRRRDQPREAISALDRAAKAGAIHPNAAARRKSRLARKVNAAVGGAAVVSLGHVAKSTGKAAAVKAAKARIAAGKAVKAKGAQTAAGKARAALSKSTRAGHGARRGEPPRLPPPRRPRPRPRAKSPAKAAAKPAAKAATEDDGREVDATKPAAKATTAKAAAPKAAAPKATAAKATTTKAAPKTTKAKKAE